MATVLIHDACLAGALGGLMQSRFLGSITPTDYSGQVNAAKVIADEFVTENALLTVPMADGDKASMYYVISAVAFAALANSGATSTTATDYLGYGKQIAAASKQAMAQLS